jgi:hypothetical protein
MSNAKLQVVTDNAGRVLAAGPAGAANAADGGPVGISLEPLPHQETHTISVPVKLRDRSIHELVAMCTVRSGGNAKAVFDEAALPRVRPQHRSNPPVKKPRATKARRKQA